MPRRCWTMRVSEEENELLKRGAKLRRKGNTVFVREAALAEARRAVTQEDAAAASREARRAGGGV